jgi:hypothetical protein
MFVNYSRNKFIIQATELVFYLLGLRNQQMTLNIMTLNIMTLNIMTLNIMTLNLITLNIITISIITLHNT